MNKISAIPVKGINYGCNKNNNNIYTKKMNTRKMNSNHLVKNTIY